MFKIFSYYEENGVQFVDLTNANFIAQKYSPKRLRNMKLMQTSKRNQEKLNSSDLSESADGLSIQQKRSEFLTAKKEHNKKMSHLRKLLYTHDKIKEDELEGSECQSVDSRIPQDSQLERELVAAHELRRVFENRVKFKLILQAEVMKRYQKAQMSGNQELQHKLLTII